MKYNSILFQLLLVLTIIVLIMYVYKKYKKVIIYEGFQQKERFLLKTDENIYDNFYGAIYDDLMLPNERAIYELDKILSTLQPEPKFSTMLDVGSGTGEFVNALKKR